MNCPVCKETALVMTERQGVEIDYCPACRGVWLDRGELDKLIERSSSTLPSQLSQTSQPLFMGNHGHDHFDHEKDQNRDGYRKKSIWKDLFD